MFYGENNNNKCYEIEFGFIKHNLLDNLWMQCQNARQNVSEQMQIVQCAVPPS